MAETRRRITQAAIDLHEAIGPLATTVEAIAARANVGRPTVYRHFPDEAALFAVCTSHYFLSHPPPNPAVWLAIDDSEQRLRSGLTVLYRYWAETAPMVGAILRDHAIAPDRVGGPLVDYMRACRDALIDGWADRGQTARRLRAAACHAVDFNTWKSLVQGGAGLSSSEAVETMLAAILLWRPVPRP